MIDPATAQFYTQRAEEWASNLPYEYSPALAKFLALLPRGSRVLDLGCGDGRDAAFMESCGFDVDATDGVPRMVELATARLGRPARLMEFSALKAEAEYDAIWAHASLLHVAEHELPDIVQNIHRALKPGAWHFSCFKGGDGGMRDKFGRFYSYIPAKILRAAYDGAGPWMDIRVDSRAGGGFDRKPTQWHDVWARKIW